jgi:hypothetical protein
MRRICQCERKGRILDSAPQFPCKSQELEIHGGKHLEKLHKKGKLTK